MDYDIQENTKHDYLKEKVLAKQEVSLIREATALLLDKEDGDGHHQDCHPGGRILMCHYVDHPLHNLNIWAVFVPVVELVRGAIPPTDRPRERYAFLLTHTIIFS